MYFFVDSILRCWCRYWNDPEVLEKLGQAMSLGASGGVISSGELSALKYETRNEEESILLNNTSVGDVQFMKQSTARYPKQSVTSNKLHQNVLLKSNKSVSQTLIAIDKIKEFQFRAPSVLVLVVGWKKRSKFLLKEVDRLDGLLPLRDILEYGYMEDTGFVWLKQKNKIEHKFEKIGRQAIYGTEITAYVDKYKIRKLTGVKINEMLIWVSLNEMSIDNPVDGRIDFKGLAGLYRTYPFSAFDNPEVKIQLEYKLPPKIIDNVEVAEEVKEAMVAKEVKDPIVAKEVKEPMAVIKKVEEPIVAKEVINFYLLRDPTVTVITVDASYKEKISKVGGRAAELGPRGLDRVCRPILKIWVHIDSGIVLGFVEKYVLKGRKMQFEKKKGKEHLEGYHRQLKKHLNMISELRNRFEDFQIRDSSILNKVADRLSRMDHKFEKNYIFQEEPFEDPEGELKKYLEIETGFEI
ncbi:hypothetical protein IFM89_031143 [Coptis chinensis]|uniref:Uncharacterized protein n=1 Tax=Coptis chinensis TaxID=261450 RepID=A0A835INQ5_9MAGN|nr:hypothetical protein IFM89_031143 [Coptis chinensis]